MTYRSWFCTVGLAAWFGVLPAAADPISKPAPFNQEAVLHKLYGCWKEVGGAVAGTPRSELKSEPIGRRFESDRFVEWTTGGEVIVDYFPPCRVDLTTTPWQLDAVSIDERSKRDGKVKVSPGIFRFDGDKLVWIRGWPSVVDPKAWPQKLPSRPTEFKSTKENGYGMVILEKIDCGGNGQKADYQPGNAFLPYTMAKPIPKCLGQWQRQKSERRSTEIGSKSRAAKKLGK